MSPILYMTFMDRISRCSQGVERLQFGGVRISSLSFVDEVALLAPSGGDLQLSLEQFAVKCEAAGIQMSTSKSETMVVSQKRVEFLLWVGSDLLPQVEDFKYLKGLVHK